MTFQGHAGGAISDNERGQAGFGFDPIFVPMGGDGRTFAEMSGAEKGRLSHRAAAFRGFGKWYADLKTAKLK
jgi:XTP/dITP diphosphohydrolase